MALPKKHNNPLALIQPVPSNWQGLQGSTASGFLIFQTPVWGVRAGFINLVNTYLNKGRNTIEKIFPVYAPKGHGGNDPEAYIKRVVSLTGIARNEVVSTREQLKKIGWAIHIVEEGRAWLSVNDFNSGFDLAMQAKPWSVPNVTPVKQAGQGLGGLLAMGVGLFFLIKIVK